MKLRMNPFIKILFLLYLSLLVACGSGGSDPDISGNEESEVFITENDNMYTNKQLSGIWVYKKFNQEGCQEYVDYNNISTPLTWKIIQKGEKSFTFIDNDIHEGEIGTDMSNEELVFQRVVQFYMAPERLLQDITFAMPCTDNEDYPGNCYYGMGVIYGYDTSITLDGPICEGTYEFVMSQISTSVSNDSGGSTDNNNYPENPTNDDLAEQREKYCRLADAAKEVYDACKANPDSGPYDCDKDKSEYLHYSRMCSTYR